MLSFFFLSSSLHACKRAVLLQCVRLCVTQWMVAHQAPLSMVGGDRQEYWSGLLWLPPGYLPDPGIEPVSLTSNLHWHVGSLPLAPSGKAFFTTG